MLPGGAHCLVIHCMYLTLDLMGNCSSLNISYIDILIVCPAHVRLILMLGTLEFNCKTLDFIPPPLLANHTSVALQD
jgi:CRISPR/Cas system-associated exonuclease Cas4 (RecB family)